MIFKQKNEEKHLNGTRDPPPPPAFMEKSIKNFHVVFWKTTLIDIENVREGFQKKSGYFNDICH